MTQVEFTAVAVVNLAVGVTEKDVVVKQDCAFCNRDVGVPEEVFGKQDGAGNNRAYGVSEDDVVGKRDGSVTKGRRWQQECQPCGLVEDKGRTPPVT